MSEDGDVARGLLTAWCQQVAPIPFPAEGSKPSFTSATRYHVHVMFMYILEGEMAAATDRIVVQVTAIQKTAIARTARRLGVTVSELMRQAAQGFMPAEDETEILALIKRVNASSKQANDALDDALSFVAQSNQRIQAMTKGKPSWE
jgi:hypothetical protein